MSGAPRDRARKIVLIAGSLTFAAIIIVSVGLGLSAQINLPSPSTQASGGSGLCVLDEVIVGANTTYTRTVTTSQYPIVVIAPEVLVEINGTQTYTVTTTLTTTSSKC